MEEDRAIEFLRVHKISKAKRKKFKDDFMPIQYYLSTWEISKIMVEYAKQRLEKGQVDTIVMLREKITAYKNAYEEAQRCSDILLSSPKSEEPKRLMDEVYRTREELFEEAT